MKFSTVLLGILGLVSAKKEITSLQIGIKKRIPPSECFASKNGDKLQMEYTGTLYSDGTQFDSSVGRSPFEFVLGSGQVIKGWDQGLLGMCVGEKRKLIIPSHLGYGDSGSGPIPGGATLVFEVELLGILNRKQPSNEL
ncbi:putative FK506 binding protein 2 [Globomyces pollinis-pini]|nr:putative FK506 binding protein 2 [Globomyces pollinis-pini]KAJ2995708.1 FK506-binding protein 2B [Globomyces sp. JEL0801]